MSSLPSGITLSTAGVLGGTPTVTGTFPIVVTATDAGLCTGTSATYNLFYQFLSHNNFKSGFSNQCKLF
ncbi:MAG: putative Ig domain-containing protein [Chitinophagaceae bacterium]|nr:putative Ig domain-containing protein [Chitinophagaceae bacterium]